MKEKLTRQPAAQGEIDAAQAYEDLFVPALFGQWAPRIAEAGRIGPGQRVLDVACGTGVLAREAAARTGASGSVAGVDPVGGMLAVAERLAPGVAWRQGTAESLPFADGTFDAVVCQFGLMFFADRPRAVGEMLRVLRPGGRLAVAVWVSLDSLPAWAAEVALLERTAGRPAADALRAPFVLGDRDELARLFAGAGAAGVEIDTQPGMARFPSIRTMVEADLRGWLPVMGVVLGEELIATILAEAERVLADWATTEGTVSFAAPAHVVTARKP